MKLIDKNTMVPAISMPGERDAEGNLTNAVRAQFGRAAVDVGTPDRGLNDDGTDAVDAVANVMHWLHSLGVDPAPVLESASRHFLAEIPSQTVESQAVDILKDAGIEACLHHTGGGIWVAEVRSQAIADRIVWVVDSEGDRAGPFLVVTYPFERAEEEIASLSGACGEAELAERVSRALSTDIEGA